MNSNKRLQLTSLMARQQNATTWRRIFGTILIQAHAMPLLSFEEIRRQKRQEFLLELLVANQRTLLRIYLYIFRSYNILSLLKIS